MDVKVVSFGFKYGTEPAADLVINARTLKNPARIRGLFYLTGLTHRVRQNVFANPKAIKMVERAEDKVRFARSSNEEQYTVAFGCTAGKHRSVALAEELVKRLRKSGRYTRVDIEHLERHKWPHQPNTHINDNG